MGFIPIAHCFLYGNVVDKYLLDLIQYNGKFSSKQLAFINKYEVCRNATVGNGKPHVVPMCYILINDLFYLATDYGIKKYKNLLKNRNVALVMMFINQIWQLLLKVRQK